MSPIWKKPSAQDHGNHGRSLKKRLAVATVAASLGVSLGVPVSDVLAQDVTSENPPGYTLKDRVNEEMDQLDQATEGDKTSGETQEHKTDSFQIKLNNKVSNQAKWDNIGSDQDKWHNLGSNQGKWDGIGSNQDKWHDIGSNQGKFKSKGSTQIKIDKNVDADMDAGAIQGNE